MKRREVISAATGTLLLYMTMGGVALLLTISPPRPDRSHVGGVTLAADTDKPRRERNKDGVKQLWRAYPLAPSREEPSQEKPSQEKPSQEKPSQEKPSQEKPSPDPSPSVEASPSPTPTPSEAPSPSSEPRAAGEPDSGSAEAPGAFWNLGTVAGLALVAVVGLGVLARLRPATPGSSGTAPTLRRPRKSGGPRFRVPRVGMPKVSVPKVSMPKVSVPKVGVPRLGLPKPGVRRASRGRSTHPPIRTSRSPRIRTRGEVQRPPPARPRHTASRAARANLAEVGKALVVVLLLGEIAYILFVTLR